MKQTKLETQDVVVKGQSDLSEAQVKESLEAYAKNAADYARMWTWNLANRDEVRQQITDHFSKWVESGAQILVAGCGVGRDLEMLNDEGFECTGLDTVKEMIEEAKSRGVKANYVVHDLREELPFEDGSFDAVYCESALEHVPKKEVPGILKEFGRILRRRGVIYVGAKRGRGEVYYRYDVGNEKDRRFYNTFEEVELHQMIVEAGFMMVEFWVDPHFDRMSHDWLSLIARKNS